jgi:hypothetical protein
MNFKANKKQTCKGNTCSPRHFARKAQAYIHAPNEIRNHGASVQAIYAPQISELLLLVTFIAAPVLFLD